MDRIKDTLYYVMKHLPALLVCVFMAFTARGKAGVADVAEKDPGLFMVMMILAMAFLAAVFMCLVALSLIAFVVVGLFFAGIVTVSTLAGIYTRSLKRGLKWFVYLGCSVCGVVFALSSMALLDFVSPGSDEVVSPMSAILAGGLVIGPLVGWIIIASLQRAHRRWASRIEVIENLRKGPQP